MEIKSSMQAIQNSTLQIISELEDFTPKAVIKRRGLRFFLGCYERGPQLLSKENRRKIEPKETPLLFDSLTTCCIYPGNLKS